MFSNDINEVILDIQEDSEEFNKIYSEIIEKITNEAYDKVVEKCNNVKLSNHVGNITKTINGTTGTISTSEDAIIFKELGTGIVGSESPHPDPTGMFADWQYDYNSHGEAGWRYPKKDGTYGWTKGQPGNAMFYNTYAEMLGEIDKKILSSLNNIK